MMSEVGPWHRPEENVQLKKRYHYEERNLEDYFADYRQHHCLHHHGTEHHELHGLWPVLMEDVRCLMEDVRWKMEDVRWKMSDVRWKM